MNNKLYSVLVLGLLFSLSLSAQWVKQTIPNLEGNMYYIFANDKNTMWTYTRDVPPDPNHVKKAEFLRTGDGGKTYKKGVLFPNAAEVFYHIQARDGKNAHLISADVNNNFTFQKTVDSGATWLMMPMQPQTFPDHVYFWDDNNGIFISDPDSVGLIIMYTTNGGSTYTRLPKTNYPKIGETEYPIVGDFQVIDNTFFFWSVDVASDKWRVWRSTDRGRNWTVGDWFTTGNVTGFTPRLAFTDSNNGLLLRGIADNYLKPLYTQDGGATWHESGNLPSYTSWPVKNIPNTQTLMALFQDTVRGMLYSALTNDLGKTWNTRKDIVPYKLDSIFTGYGFPAFTFTNLDIVSNNAAWARFSLRELYRYDSSTPIVPEKPDLDLELKADNDGLPLYGQVKYTLTVTNRGISPATGVKINWLPPYKRTNNGAGAYAFQSAYADKGRYDGWNGVWTLDKIEAGATATATFWGFVVDNTKAVTQTAQVVACNESDLDSAPNNMGAVAKEDDEVSFTAIARNNFAEMPSASYQGKMTDFAVSPNPAKDKISVSITATNENMWSLRVLNNIGQTVYTRSGQNMSTVEIDAKSFENGLYIIEYQSEGERKVEKVMIQH